MAETTDSVPGRATGSHQTLEGVGIVELTTAAKTTELDTTGRGRRRSGAHGWDTDHFERARIRRRLRFRRLILFFFHLALMLSARERDQRTGRQENILKGRSVVSDCSRGTGHDETRG